MGPVECSNVCEDPENGFEFSFEDLEKLDDPNTLGTFHTHPNHSNNLSYEDYESFLNYPVLVHYIIGNDGVKSYKIVGEKVVNAS